MDKEKTVIGFFQDRGKAENAVTSLLNKGFTREQISMMLPKGDQEAPAVGEVHGVGADDETGKDTFWGGIAGLIAGVVLLSIPGIGPFFAAGPLAGAVGGLGIGAGTGALIGWLKESGMSEEEAQFYAEGLRRGGAVVAVHTNEDKAGDASHVIDDCGAVNIRKTAGEWREGGWEIPKAS